ncbi:hypothetical protein SAY87_009506 [Trapa incisa]|uniref:Uncharacterized protein n=1 Tax=Trapa incisa TaxID=236973 RepID=A0AAN7PXZ3_9MYRT|nr:hypothetical protein SAY87_009506 [Trapa incisa]
MSEIMSLFYKPSRKTMISAIATPYPKKNITTLVKDFDEYCPLRELTNPTMVMGNWNDIDEMSGTNGLVLLYVLKLQLVQRDSSAYKTSSLVIRGVPFDPRPFTWFELFLA